MAAASVLMSHQALQRDHSIVSNSGAVINSIYHTVHAALWALVIAGSVVLLLHIPEMRKGRAIAEARRLQEISEQNRFYCEKWGMPARSHEHLICTMDLDHIRKEIEESVAAATAF
jgi:predicted nuclease with TOPRIM domain